jgi:NitT/TauT family transport system substrate-binding protein
MPVTVTRRKLLTALSAGGAVGVIGAPQVLTAAEAPETTTVRLRSDRSICIAPMLVVEELLRSEGFTDVRFVEIPAGISPALANAGIDFNPVTPWWLATRIDSGDPSLRVTTLAGMHIGCFELFAREGIRSAADLKGKSVGLKSAAPLLLSLLAAHVGLDPKSDLRWVTDSALTPIELFAEGKIDAFFGFPPEPQELRARHAGDVILNTTLDRPWSQYFCCMLAGNSEYVRKYPVATKRVLRAVLKAADFCANEPGRAAQWLVDGGFTPRYDYAFETLSDIPFAKWREYDAEDSIRFYALRMRDAGMIKSSPQKIIADGTDWRFLNELKRELKA